MLSFTLPLIAFSFIQLTNVTNQKTTTIIPNNTIYLNYNIKEHISSK